MKDVVMSRGIRRILALISGVMFAGCEQPVLPLPVRPPVEAPPEVRPVRVVERPAAPQPAQLPVPLPVPPPPAPPPSKLAPPQIRWHERLAQEGTKNRQRGMWFRIVYRQAPMTVSTRVTIKDRFGLESQFTADRAAGLDGYAGIEEFLANTTREHAPFLVKVEYFDPDEDSWGDAVGYEYLPGR